MEAAVVVALISSVSGLVVAGATAYWTSTREKENRRAQKDLSDVQTASQRDLEMLKDRLQREATDEERRLKASQELARFRDPLLEAAHDLGQRIDNIREGDFLAYLTVDGPRRETAIVSTLYRLARYFGTLEILHARGHYLRFERDEDTREVAARLAEIETTFASDEYDRDDDVRFETSRFMIWREEQRAIGELIRATDENETELLLGFATFAANVKRDPGWFADFVNDLETADARTSERFKKLQSLLAKLVHLLDDEGRYTSPDVEPTDGWMRRAALGPPRQDL